MSARVWEELAEGAKSRLAEFAGFAGERGVLLPRWLFLRLLATQSFVAFLGWFREGPALIGPEGLLPAGSLAAEIAQHAGGPFLGFLRAPSVFWLNSSEAFIQAVTVTGMLCSVALFLNVFPRAALALMWALYLSIFSLATELIPAQLDGLMLEVLLLSAFFAPRGARPGLGAASPPHPLAVFAMRFFIFRVMFESGLTKLVGPDSEWLSFSIMKNVFQSAPYPTTLAFFAYHLPWIFQAGMVAHTFAAELGAPLISLVGRWPRALAVAVWLGFQLGIISTMNFGWLNYSAIAASLMLLDDRLIIEAARLCRAARLADRLAGWAAARTEPAVSAGLLRPVFVWTALSLHTYCTLFSFGIGTLFMSPRDFNSVLVFPYRLLSRLHSANGYSLYYATRALRVGLVIEGTVDGGATWKEYPSGFQALEPDSMCAFFAPYFSRFDAAWVTYGQMADHQRFFEKVARRLTVGDRKTVGLFASDPFGGRAPEAVRLTRYSYHFTSWDEWRRTGQYWSRQPAARFGPPLIIKGK